MEYGVPEGQHTNHVNAWIAREGKGLSSEQLLQLCEKAMAALWKRTYLTLGDVTLTAIADRVLYSAAEKYPPFESLRVEKTGIDWHVLHERRPALRQSELEQGVRFILAEFMAVIGSLTAEILTPALHAELSNVTLRNPASGDQPGKRQS